MGLVMPAVMQLVRLCIIGFALAIQGSKGFGISPSPVSFPANAPTEETPDPITHKDSWRSNTPRTVPSGLDGLVGLLSPAPLHVFPPLRGIPSAARLRDLWRRRAPSLPPESNGLEPSLSPRAPLLSPPYKLAPSLQGHVPPVQPSAPQRKLPVTPGASPSGIIPKNAPSARPSIHGRFAFAPDDHKSHAPEIKAHIPNPISPVSVALPPWKQQNPPDPVAPKVTPSTFPAPAPNFNWKRGRVSFASPPYETPKTMPPQMNSPSQGHHSPAFSPSTPSYKRQHSRNRVSSPVPASPHVAFPPTLEHQGPALSPSSLPTSGHSHSHYVPAPLRSDPTLTPSSLSSTRHKHYAPVPLATGTTLSPSSLPTSGHRRYAPAPLSSGSSLPPFLYSFPSPASHSSPVPSPLTEDPSHPTKIPLLAPKVSPFGHSSKSPKKPQLPPVQALPPPPPNEDCSSTVCAEPYTNTLPGSPCGCVLPMQVGLRLSVPLYTFFPLVSELAAEIAIGVFMKQSQVRIMGANAARQQPEKTVVLIDLVPLGQKFDKTTAYLTSERFWHRKVVIDSSYFGDYEVLYVIYPGLPPSPPLPPSSITIIDGVPYSNNSDNSGMIKPLGVDVHKKQHSDGLNHSVIAIIVLSVLVVVVLCSVTAWLLLFKHKEHSAQPKKPLIFPPSLAKRSGSAGPLTGSGLSSASLSLDSSIAAYSGSAKTFSMHDMMRATDNFHDSRLLGEGGFGRVCSGVLEDGTKVAIKVLKRDNQQGGREFLAEVEMLSRLHHRNLVKLIGICIEDRTNCLVYELIPNGSLESHLHGVHKETASLDWGARMKIALGAARGLAYLHEDSSPRVIHRDFKSSNILLEYDFTPKVSDFGLARTTMDEEKGHISTRVMGTFGYVAPEYAMTGHLLVKSDVYSYGVVLLELLTGRKPVDMSQPPGQENLVAWARPLLTSEEGLKTIIDPCIRCHVPFDSVAKVAAIASMCVQPEVSNRPFMGEVVQALKLVCNECDEANDGVSRSSSQEDLSIGLDTGVCSTSGQLPDNLQRRCSVTTNYDSVDDVEGGLSASKFFNSSARFPRQASGSFRIYSWSGPLSTGRSRQFWQIIKTYPGGSVSEHRIMLKFWSDSR